MTPFYSNGLLAQEGTGDRYGMNGIFKPISDVVLEKISNSRSTSYLSQHYLNKKSEHYRDSKRVNFLWNQDKTRVVIQQQLYSSKNPAFAVTIVQVTLSTIDSNCGTILISNLQTEYHGFGLGSDLFEQALKYINTAGYSYILLNTAGTYQNPLGQKLFQDRYGFSPLPQPYINKRSGNINVWYQKFMNGVNTVSLANINDNTDKEDEDDDYDD